MQLSNSSRVVLCLAGSVAIAIGGLILRSPTEFYAMNQIDLGNNVNLLSEIRAPAGALVASGFLMVLGAFISSLTFTATVLAALLYLAYGFSRLLGMVIDGIPASSLVWSGGIEIALGLLCLLCLWNGPRSLSDEQEGRQS